MGSQSQRRLEPAIRVEREVVAPLSGPCYGPFSVARRKWRKPLQAIIADAIANCRAVSVRLQRGMYMPDMEGKPHYWEVYQHLCRSTDQQLKALEAFAQIEWRE